MDRLKLQTKIGNIICGVVKNKSDVAQAQKLRYDMLVMEFNSNNVNASGTDASEYDELCDHLVAIDTDTNQVVGTYRVLTYNNLLKKGGKHFVSEEEFDLTNLKNQKDGIVELSRAVVHPDYRNGVVIKMLWRALDMYCKEYNIRYMFGTASFHGIDECKYSNALAWLKSKYLVDKSLDCKPKSPKVRLGNKYDLTLAKDETPSLIKGYLSIGCKVASGAYKDIQFGSIDVLTILDLQNTSRVLERFLK